MKRLKYNSMLCLGMLFLLNAHSQICPDTSCTKKKPLPMRDASYANIQIDTIDANLFQTVLDTIYIGMENGTLTKLEERGLIKLMNTVDWSSFDKQEEVLKKFPKLKEIEDMFNRYYEKALYCKYTTGLGKGFSLYYKELDIFSMGVPEVCSRFVIR